MNKAYKFRIYPNLAQRILFGKTFGCCRFIYNKMLSEKIAYYKETEKTLNITPAKYKADFEWLKEVDSLALCNEQLNLDKAYKNFFRDKKVGFPKFKNKKNDRKSYTTNCVNNNIRIDGKFLVLPKIGKLRIKQHRNIPSGYILKSVTVSQNASGKYYASVLYEYNEDIQPEKASNVLGLDFSMSELYIDSNGEHADYPRYYRRALEKLGRMQRALSKMVKYSNNYYKQRRKIAKFHERIANQRKDFLHKHSRQITNAVSCVAIEDLNMKAMQKSLNFGKSVNDNAWGMFTSFLTYKLAEQGKQLIKVDKWFPSSKTCSVCGAKKDELLLSECVYVCDCGNVMNRDVNAAINIKNEAIRILAAD
ncbi:transposase [Clostridia bacterium]|nr:transposase [Clostridia bacterium]